MQLRVQSWTSPREVHAERPFAIPAGSLPAPLFHVEHAVVGSCDVPCGTLRLFPKLVYSLWKDWLLFVCMARV